ncbi:MAG: hypothetical protein D6803_05715, partial [Anaerolineae bacterium]
MALLRSSDRLPALQGLTLSLGATLDVARECETFLAWLEDLCQPAMAALFVRSEEGDDVLRLICARGVQRLDEEEMPVDADPWEWLAGRGVEIPGEVEQRLALPIRQENR